MSRATGELRQRRGMMLVAWAVASVVAGGLMLVEHHYSTVWLGLDRARSTLLEPIGMQFVIWGLIDLPFGLLGLRRDDGDPAKLIRILRFSEGLNWVWLASGVGLVVGGVWLPVLLGHGLGVLVQGGFLFWYDRTFRRELEAMTGSVDAAGSA